MWCWRVTCSDVNEDKEHKEINDRGAVVEYLFKEHAKVKFYYDVKRLVEISWF